MFTVSNKEYPSVTPVVFLNNTLGHSLADLVSRPPFDLSAWFWSYVVGLCHLCNAPENAVEVDVRFPPSLLPFDLPSVLVGTFLAREC